MLNITNSTVVNVATPGYFQNISDLVFNPMYVASICMTDQYKYTLKTFFYSNDNTTTNYARWQLLYSEYNHYAGFLSDGIKDIFKIEFPYTKTTTSLSCARFVESSMPLTVTRPFVEEFITKEDTDKVNVTLH